MQAAVVADSAGLGIKVLILKSAFPRLDLKLLTTTYPTLLTWSVEQMRDNVEQVRPCMHACSQPAGGRGRTGPAHAS